MNLLLDTHVFLWWHSDRTKLSPKVVRLCEDTTNNLYLSSASVWEIQIKLQIGKLKLTKSLNQIIDLEGHENGIEVLPISLSHIYALDQLPSHHRDPFDRILIAQARVEALTLITQDSLITQYPVQSLW